MCNEGGGDRGPQSGKHLPPSTFTGHFFKKSRYLGFDVFIDIWSMLIVCVIVIGITLWTFDYYYYYNFSEHSQRE